MNRNPEPKKPEGEKVDPQKRLECALPLSKPEAAKAQPTQELPKRPEGVQPAFKPEGAKPQPRQEPPKRPDNEPPKAKPEL